MYPQTFHPFTVLITFSRIFATNVVFRVRLLYTRVILFNESQHICPIIMNNIVHCVPVVFTPSVLSTYMSRVSRK